MNGAGYQPIEFGGEDYFKKSAEILNEEIDKQVRKAMKGIAEKSVSQFGLVPGGASVMGDIMGDIEVGGIKAKQRGMTGIALGASLPQFQAEFQAGESEKQRTFLGEQADLDRQLKEMIAKVIYEMGLAQAEGSKVPWWQSLLQTGAEVLPYV